MILLGLYLTLFPAQNKQCLKCKYKYWSSQGWCGILCNLSWPFLHIHGLWSSFLAVFARLWCTASLRSPPAAAWCVWSACGNANTREPFNSSLTQIIEGKFGGFTLQGLLANEASTLALLAGVGVLREEQLRPVQHVHQHRQLGLDQRAQAVLQGRHDVLRVEGEEAPDCCAARGPAAWGGPSCVPAAAQWCSCSPWRPSPPSPAGRRYAPTVSNSWLFSARCCWIWQRGCAPGCPGPRGWRSLCPWLSKANINTKHLTYTDTCKYIEHKHSSCLYWLVISLFFNGIKHVFQ